MLLTRLLLPTTAAVVMVLHAGAAAAAPASPGRCPPPHHRVLASNPSAVVFLGTGSAIERLERPGGGYEYNRFTFPELQGCARGAHRRAYALGEPVHTEGSAAGFSSEGVRGETLGGTIVAYEELQRGCGRESEQCSASWVVVVRDLRTGRRIRKLATGTPPAPDPDYVGIGETTKIVVKPNGSVAWIVSAVRGEGYYQLHAVDSTGNRVLASGEDIAPRSLALHGSTLSWTQGGVRGTAVLH